MALVVRFLGAVSRPIVVGIPPVLGSLLLDKETDSARVSGFDYHLMTIWCVARGPAERPNGGSDVLPLYLPQDAIFWGGCNGRAIARNVAV